MQVDFYHLTRDPAEKLVPMLADKCLGAGARVLLVSEDDEQQKVLSKALWTQTASSFLAHEIAGQGTDDSQPVLISSQCQATNAARYIMLADGRWRDEALEFERVFYLFTAAAIEDARTTWRALSAKENVEPRYWKQDSGRWVEGP